MSEREDYADLDLPPATKWPVVELVSVLIGIMIVLIVVTVYFLIAIATEPLIPSD